jgi:hypothetical protein
VAEEVESLFCKHEALSFNLSPIKTKKRKEKKDTEQVSLMLLF